MLRLHCPSLWFEYRQLPGPNAGFLLDVRHDFENNLLLVFVNFLPYQRKFRFPLHLYKCSSLGLYLIEQRALRYVRRRVRHELQA